MPEPHLTTGHQPMRNDLRMAVWTLAWLITLAVAAIGPTLIWDSSPVFSWIAVVANLIAGVGWIVAHARYLRAVDELQRKIMMDAIAVALGVGLIGGTAYAVATTIDLITLEANMAVLTAVMALVYLGAVIVGYLRVR